MVSLMEKLGYFARTPWLVYAAVVIIALQAGYDLASRILTRTPHHTVISNGMTKTVYQVGEQIATDLVTDRDMPEGCYLNIQRFVTEQPSGVIIWSQVAPGLAGHGRQHFSRVIPVHLKPGHYQYFFNAVNECGARSYLTVSPPASFEVVPQGAGSTAIPSASKETGVP